MRTRHDTQERSGNGVIAREEETDRDSTRVVNVYADADASGLGSEMTGQGRGRGITNSYRECCVASVCVSGAGETGRVKTVQGGEGR